MIKAKELLRLTLIANRDKKKLIKQLENWVDIGEAVRLTGRQYTSIHRSAKNGKINYIDVGNIRLFWKGDLYVAGKE